MSRTNRKISKKSGVKSKKKSTILKRRGSSAERVILWGKRFGLVFGVFVFLGWLGSWFFMSDASARFGSWAEQKLYDVTVDAGFDVQNILVEGRQYTDVDALKAIINVDKGDALLSLKPNEVKAQLEKLSWVKSVQVERRFPQTVYIGLTERKPMALWQRQKRLSLIDENGVILTEHKLERFQNLIILTGEEVPEQAYTFLRQLQAQEDIQKRVEAATFISGRRWDLKLKNGVTVKLPEVETALALSRLALMQQEENLMDQDVKVIDVREQTRITVRTKPGAVTEYQTGYQKTGGQI